VSTPLLAVAKERKHASAAIAIGGAAVIAYSVAAWAMWPRVVARSKSPQPPDHILVIRWVFALSAYLIGVGAICVGGQQWCYALGMVASVVLLAMTARAARNGATRIA
jgi:hypothetical protein